MQATRPVLAAVTAVLASVALTACATSEASTSTTASAASSTSETAAATPTDVTIYTARGEVTVATNPTKVVVYEHGILDTIDTLGFGDSVVVIPHHVVPSYLSDYTTTTANG